MTRNIFICLLKVIFSVTLRASEGVTHSNRITFNEYLKQKNSVFSVALLEEYLNEKDPVFPVTSLAEYRRKRNPISTMTSLAEYRRKRNPVLTVDPLEEYRSNKSCKDNLANNQSLAYRHNPYADNSLMSQNESNYRNDDLSKKLADILCNKK